MLGELRALSCSGRTEMLFVGGDTVDDTRGPIAAAQSHTLYMLVLTVLLLCLLLARLLRVARDMIERHLMARTLAGLFRYECFNDWGGRRYNDFVPGEVTKTTSSGDRTT